MSLWCKNSDCNKQLTDEQENIVLDGEVECPFCKKEIIYKKSFKTEIKR